MCQHFFGGDVVVISTATNSIIATIPVGPLVGSVIITPDGKRAYAASDHNLAVIDTHTNAVVQSIAVNSVPDPSVNSLAITPDGKDIYVAGETEDDFQVVATATNTVVQTAPFNQQIIAMAITPDGTKAYTTIFPFESLIIIDTASNTIESTLIPVDGVLPSNLAITPDGAQVYVANQESNTVSVISTATNTLVTTIPVGSNPVGVAIANLSTPFCSLQCQRS